MRNFFRFFSNGETRLKRAGATEKVKTGAVSAKQRDRERECGRKGEQETEGTVKSGDVG